MYIYIPVVLTAVLLSSGVLAWLLMKNGLFNIKMFAATVLALSAASLLFPFILSAVARVSGYTAPWPNIFIGFSGSVILFAVIFYTAAALFPMVISGEKADVINRQVNKRAAMETAVGITIGMGKTPADGEPMRLEILKEQTENNVENYETAPEGTHMPEIVIDIEQNTDKMEIVEIFDEQFENFGDNCMQEDRLAINGDLSIDDLINEAFRLKELEDIEGAILYYMHVLDRKPAKALEFQVILDISVLYLILGQGELAKEILRGYAEKYGDMMEESIKAEIDKIILLS